MATHSSILAWKIPKTEEPVGYPSMGFSRQEFWSGLQCPPSGDLPNPGIYPGLLHRRRMWLLYRLSHQGSPDLTLQGQFKCFTGQKALCGAIQPARVWEGGGGSRGGVQRPTLVW